MSMSSNSRTNNRHTNRQSLSLSSYPGDIFNTRNAGDAPFGDENAIVDGDAEHSSGAPDQPKHDLNATEAMNWLYSADTDQTPRASDQDHFSLASSEDFLNFGRNSAQFDFGAFNQTGLLSPQVSRQSSNADATNTAVQDSQAGKDTGSSGHRQFMNVQGDYRAARPEASIMTGLLLDTRQGQPMQPLSSQLSSSRIVARLLAPTSMRRSTQEDSQTYLNKSQLYGLSLVDTEHKAQGRQVKYRTTVKVLFHDEDQKHRAATFWSIWRDGRGMTEAVERKAPFVRALEFDEAGPVKMMEKHKADVIARPVLVAEAFDGFTVDWSPVQQSPCAQTMLALRCHFLSTDFSHSKGVRGVSLKLAVKTEICTNDQQYLLGGSACLIKLFRDKGAERKAANDLSHVRKALQRLEDPHGSSLINSASGPIVHKGHVRRESDFQVRVQHRRKRSASVSSQSSGNGSQTEEYSRLDEIDMYRAMLASVEPSTLLQLPLEDGDNMALSFDDEISLQAKQVEPVSTEEPQTTYGRLSPQSVYQPAFRASPQPVLLGDFRTILVADMDDHYVPPKPQKKPVKCFYFMQQMESTSKTQTMSPVSDGSPDMRGEGENPGTSKYHPSQRNRHQLGPIYRAVYLYEYSVNAFVSVVAKKLSLDAEKHRIVRCVRENNRGIRILLEAEMLERMPDGQDMLIRLHEVGPGQIELVLHYALA
ncbi:CP2 transcription factor-domain-containing protein [Protomyces lactucae-debilis]|uniref:CP2 transcription factor-domain-containing protein n=1 Tax=Protomyces lactucae-debilis TaxID=2754530 RepID=A0A1Y2FLP5_PROLT|nr:CP2 transcription factor-domain-containing protein [Protomyces lactucae-debilis]ORY84497.1 CP2 transcription factor-domain-containing protein [Protomyces lactucae-debilis]